MKEKCILMKCILILFIFVIMHVSFGYAAPLAVTSGTLYLSLEADSLGLADGEAVTSWTDSASGNIFAGAATYDTDFANGHAGVLFNGTSDTLRAATMSGTVPNTSTVTMFVVGQFLSGLGGTDYMVSGQTYADGGVDGDVSGDNRLRLAVSSIDWRTRVGDGGNIDSSGDIADIGQHVFTVVSGQDATNAVRMLVDGTQVAAGTHGTTSELSEPCCAESGRPQQPRDCFELC